MEYSEILGVRVHTIRRKETIELCRKWILDKECNGRHIVTANPEIILIARSDPWFASVLDDADLVTADGVGIQWAASFLQFTRTHAVNRVGLLKRFLKTLGAVIARPSAIRSPVPERISGSDIIVDVAAIAADERRRVFLIGGRKGTTKRAADRLRQWVPGIDVFAYEQDHIATPYSPYGLHLAIDRIQPNVVFVGYGAPRQEEWIHQNLHRYRSVRLAMGVGGALDFLAGNAPRAPIRYQQRGLEWFWRVVHQPTRVVRIIHATVHFPLLVLREALKR